MSKFKTIKKVGIEPVLAGLKNKIIPTTETERKAIKRAKICAKCNDRVDEPVKYLQITDNKIPVVSKKMCNECWCALPLKIRQDIEICKKWNV